jgi:hypothetical protein
MHRLDAAVVVELEHDGRGHYAVTQGRLVPTPTILAEMQTRSHTCVLVFAGVLMFAACTSAADSLAERCRQADSVVATYQLRIEEPIRLENPWMVESRDQSLEAWYFVSAMVSGGDFDGRIATWQLPGFGPTAGVDPINTPNLSMAANSVAENLDIGSTLTLDPTEYGVDMWAELEGFHESQRCLDLARS